MLHLQNVSPQAGWTTSPLACTTFVLYLYSSFFSARLWLIALQIATIAEDDLLRGTGQLFFYKVPLPIRSWHPHDPALPLNSSKQGAISSFILLLQSSGFPASLQTELTWSQNKSFQMADPSHNYLREWQVMQKKKRVLQVYLIVNHNCKKTQLSIQREHTIPIMLPHSYAKLCPHSHWFNSMTSGSASTSDSPGPTAGSEPSPVVSKAQVLALACYFFSHFLTTHGSLF